MWVAFEAIQPPPFQTFETILEVKNWHSGVVIVAQLAEQSLPIPEVRGSNRLLGCIEMTKTKKNKQWLFLTNQSALFQQIIATLL